MIILYIIEIYLILFIILFYGFTQIDKLYKKLLLISHFVLLIMLFFVCTN